MSAHPHTAAGEWSVTVGAQSLRMPARLLSVTVNDAPAHRVRWTLPKPMLTSVDSSPLLLTHSLFAEWRVAATVALNVPPIYRGVVSASTRPAAHAHLTKQRRRVCSNVNGTDCVIPANTLPLGVSIQFRLLTECDHRRMAAAGRNDADSIEYLSSMSEPMRTTLRKPRNVTYKLSRHNLIDRVLSRHVRVAGHLIAPSRPVELEPLLRVPQSGLNFLHQRENGLSSLVSADPAVDPAVAAALCAFFTATSGSSSWYNSYGWCQEQSTIPVCGTPSIGGWFGVGCTQDNLTVSQISLGQNGLRLLDPSGSVNALWPVLAPSLDVLDLSSNGWLGVLDLRSLTNLHSLTLHKWRTSPLAGSDASSPPPSFTPLLIPAKSSLKTLSVDQSSLWVDLSCTPVLQTLDATGSTAPWQLSQLWDAPLLTGASFAQSNLNSSDATPTEAPDGNAYMYGELTQYILSNFAQTNPALASLDLSSTPLNFGRTISAQRGNFPLIRAPFLTELLLSQLPQLHTGPWGPPPNWLQGLPSLTFLDVSQLPHVLINTSAFANGFAPDIQQLDLSSTSVIGTLEPLYALKNLNGLVLDDSNVASTLPGMIAAVWPAMAVLSAMRCRLHGRIPTFVNACPIAVFLNDKSEQKQNKS